MPPDGCLGGPSSLGRVALVGAGPGDPDLLTVRAARLLSQADVVLVDALVDPRVLALCRPGARLLDVGKLGFGPKVAQAETNALLVHEARSGAFVVRLKGGDPFVFGRGGEEALALAAAGIPCEIVPGLSSALTAPALHGIPVTHRGVATAFTVLTGTTATAAVDRTEAQWAQAARTGGTLVFLMAMHCLGRVVEVLRDAGVPTSTPAAVVASAAQAGERVVVSTLAGLLDDVRAAGVAAPAVVIVGDVVAVRGEVQEQLAQALSRSSYVSV